jgi:hypothetical protein
MSGELVSREGVMRTRKTMLSFTCTMYLIQILKTLIMNQTLGMIQIQTLICMSMCMSTGLEHMNSILKGFVVDATWKCLKISYVTENKFVCTLYKLN